MAIKHYGNWAVLLAAYAYLSVSVAADDSPPLFDLYDFAISGNTVLNDETLERAVYPFLGPGKTVDDVEHARSALEEAYRQAGYPSVIVAIPEQDIVAGKVQLEVVEGRIDIQHISGSRYYALDPIRAAVPALAEGKVPHMPSVQEQLTQLAQTSADRNITPVFRAGSTPGKMEVELKVKDELPLHGSVELNSRNTANTDYTRLIGSLRYDNLWQKYHSASLQYQVAPENAQQVSVWSGTYVLPTGWEDTRLALYGIGINSSTQLGANVGSAAVVGTGNIFGLRLLKPLPEILGFQDNLSFGFDYKNFDQALSLLGVDTGKNSIQYAKFSTGYEVSRRSEEQATAMSITGHYSLRGVGNDAAQFSAKRIGASPNFFYLTGDIKHMQLLPWDFRMQARGQGQASMAPLISNEQFAAGGPLSVRGYHQTQVLADQGANLSFELHSPSLLPSDWDFAQNLRMIGFIDWAYLWTISPLAPTSPTAEIAGTGTGFRTQWFKHLLGELDWSFALVKQGTIYPGNQRVDFRVVYEF